MTALLITIAGMFMWTANLFFMAGFGYLALTGTYYLIKGYFLDLEFKYIFIELGLDVGYWTEITGLIGLDNLIKDHIIFAPFYQGCFITGFILWIITFIIMKSGDREYL